MTRETQAGNPVEAVIDAGLARCLRRCTDLEAQLRHAVAEQERIRRTLQARLTAVTQSAEQARREQEVQLHERLAERERSETELLARLAASAGELSALQARFAALSSAQASLTASLEEKERLLRQDRANFEAHSSTLESALSLLRTERDELCRDLAATQAKAEMVRGDLDAQVERLKGELALVELAWETRHQAELQAINGRLMAAELELRGVYRSLSWRLTTPLRMINRLFSWSGRS